MNFKMTDSKCKYESDANCEHMVDFILGKPLIMHVLMGDTFLRMKSGIY